MAPGKVTYDYVILRVQTPLVLRLKTKGYQKQGVTELKKHLAFTPRTGDFWNWTIRTNEVRILEALRMRESQNHTHLYPDLQLCPFFYLGFSILPLSFQAGPFLLLFTLDHSPFQGPSLTALTMAPLLGHPGGPPGGKCFSVSLP